MTQAAQAVTKANYKWRVVDIVVAAIVAVASGVIFWGWDFVYAAPQALLEGLAPGFKGLIHGMWLFAGPLAAVIVRKPGAALFSELLAAAIELILGSQFGISGLLVGLVQGLGSEIGFAVFAYKKWNIGTTALSGALAGVADWFYDWQVKYPGWGSMHVTIYLITCAISGAVIAGVVVWFLSRAIASTGVLERFESGRVQARV